MTAPIAPSPGRGAGDRERPVLATAARHLVRGLAGAVFRLEVLGAEHVPATGPVLLAPNHTGFLDGPLVWAVCPRATSMLTKAEMFRGPLARPLGWLGQIPVRRGRPDRGALRAGAAVLARGGALGVFPEGTRGTGRLEQVQDGLAWFALRTGAPVVPISVQGTLGALPRGRHLPRLRAPVRVVFGAPAHAVPDGDPAARSTVRRAAEQLRLAHLSHLERAAALEAPDAGPAPRRPDAPEQLKDTA